MHDARRRASTRPLCITAPILSSLSSHCTLPPGHCAPLPQQQVPAARHRRAPRRHPLPHGPLLPQVDLQLAGPAHAAPRVGWGMLLARKMEMCPLPQAPLRQRGRVCYAHARHTSACQPACAHACSPRSSFLAKTLFCLPRRRAGQGVQGGAAGAALRPAHRPLSAALYGAQCAGGWARRRQARRAPGD